MVTFQGVQSEQEISAILALQTANLSVNISKKEAQAQGFVTVRHTLAILRAMNTPYGHTIAKHGDAVVGFALTMTQEFRDQIPVLLPLFERLDTLNWAGKPCKDLAYVMMGQVCVAKAYRGQGVFAGLYRKMQERMAPHFELIVTEISERNTRSLRAHEKIGFVEMLRYIAPNGERWVIVGLPTKQ